MSSIIDLTKQVFEKQQYLKVVNTSFTELTIGGIETINQTAQPPSIQDFFNTYSQIFYDIPKTGETNSHQYLVNQSGNYIGGESTNVEVEALLVEVTSLREENLQLQQQLLDIQTPNG